MEGQDGAKERGEGWNGRGVALVTNKNQNLDHFSPQGLRAEVDASPAIPEEGRRAVPGGGLISVPS